MNVGQKKNLTEFVKFLSSVRRRAGFSQSALCSAVGLKTAQSLRELEQGYVQPTAERLEILLGAMGYELAIVPKGYRDFALNICEEKKKIDDETVSKDAEQQ